MRRIILASQSPRRRELLARLGFPFEVVPSGADEDVDTSDPIKAVEELSLRKAEWVLRGVLEGNLVIGSDTVVVLDGEILGKPKDEEDAFHMLTRLSGRTHHVCTGVTLAMKERPENEKQEVIRETSFHEVTEVHVARMSPEEIRRYIATGEPMDKAGAYGIQGAFAPYISGITGDYYNVVGLPLCHLYQELREGGWLSS